LIVYPGSVPADYTTLPANLPAPEDDGAAGHLAGMAMAALVLDSSQGPVDLAELGAGRAVIYIYPHTGAPDEPLPDGWDAFPGARGCTPESSGFRDHAAELAAAGARIAGLSGQTLAEQVEFAERNRMPFPVIADPKLRLRDALSLPTFELHGVTFLRRLTLVVERGTIVRAFYPVFPPDRHAAVVLGWLERRGPLGD
jgi:peroxiredoxin